MNCLEQARILRTIIETAVQSIQDGVTYLCNRDTVNPVYNPLSELVGIYVEIVN